MQLVRLGALLRSLAREHDCAIVVANQVADRFAPLPATTRSSAATSGLNNPLSSSPASTPSTTFTPPAVLSLDHQQRFFTGWGSHPSSIQENQSLKTPSLGLVWTNQISCRIALVKERAYEESKMIGGKEGNDGVIGGAEWSPGRWRRWMRIAFAPWVIGTEEQDMGVEFDIWGGGLRAVGQASLTENKA